MKNQPKISFVPLIKFIRHYSNCGLKDGKDLAEALVSAGLVEISPAGHEVQYPIKKI